MVLGSWGCRRGGRPHFTAKDEEGSADSSKIEGTLQRGIVLGSYFGPQMWQIPVVFTMRSRDPKGGQEGVLLGSYLRCLGRSRGEHGVRVGSYLQCLGRFRGFRCLVLLAAGVLPSVFRTFSGSRRGAVGVLPSVFRTF